MNILIAANVAITPYAKESKDKKIKIHEFASKSRMSSFKEAPLMVVGAQDTAALYEKKMIF